MNRKTSPKCAGLGILLAAAITSPAHSQIRAKLEAREAFYQYHSDSHAVLVNEGRSNGANNFGATPPNINYPFIDFPTNPATQGTYVKIWATGDIRYADSGPEQVFGSAAVFTANGNISARDVQPNRFNSRGNYTIPVRSLGSSRLGDLTNYLSVGNVATAATSNPPDDFPLPSSNDTTGVIVRVPQGSNCLFGAILDTTYIDNGDPDADAYLNVVGIDNSLRPRFRFLDASYTVAEGSVVGVRIQRYQGTAYRSVVYLRTKPGTAQEGTDFNPVGWTKVVFAPYDNEETVWLQTNNNEIYEQPEVFQAELAINFDDNDNEGYINNPTPAPNAASYTQDNATINITITDTSDFPQLRFQRVGGTLSRNVNEGDGAISVIVELSKAADRPTNVWFATGLAESTAKEGLSTDPSRDYAFEGLSLDQKMVTIPALQKTATIKVHLNNDSIYEGPETIAVGLGIIPEYGTYNGELFTLNVADNEAPPTVSFDSPTATVPESQGTATRTLSINRRSAFPTVINLSYTGTASSGSDYTAPSSLTIPAGQLSIPLSISIINNNLREATESLIITISSVTDGISGTSNTHTLSITDDDLPAYAENKQTGTEPPFTPSTWPLTSLFASIPDLPNPDTIPTWRIKGEPVWRMNGDKPSGLAPGLHTIEFRPLSGLITPPDRIILVGRDGTISGENLIDNPYRRVLTTLPGSLRVNLTSGPAAARWKLEGETVWRTFDTTINALPAGTHRIVLQTIPGFEPIGLKSINISSGENAVANINYSQKSTAIQPTPITLAATKDSPASFCGQIKSSTGFASGVAVHENVVITTAHALFDAEKLVFTNHVDFYHQRHQDEYVPGEKTDDPNPTDPAFPTMGGGAQTARAWFVLSGYAAERADGSASSSTPRAQYLDVGAVLFDEPVARGGKAGLLESTKPTSEWLVQDPAIQTVFNKTLIGYPVEKIDYAHLGKMHASIPARIRGFVPAVDGPVAVTYLNGERETIPSKNISGVYTTPELISSGGMSGGGLFVEDSGTYRLAAIYLGESGPSGVFRAIDGEVIDLIDRVTSLTDNSSGSDGYDANDTSSDSAEFLFQELTVGIGGINEGATTPGSWRIVGDRDNNFISGQKYLLIGSDGEAAVVFNPVPGYLTPPIQHITRTNTSLLPTGFNVYAEYTPDFRTLQADIQAADPGTLPANLEVDADLDGDGITNLLEWASGLNMNNPGDAANLDPTNGTSGIPFTRLSGNPGNKRLETTFIRLSPTLVEHVTYIPEFSSDMINWSPDTLTPVVTAIGGHWQRVTVRDSFPLSPATPRRYARVRVVYTPPTQGQ